MLQGFFTPDLDPSRDYNERDRKRRLAEALMMQGADYSPVRSWTQGASRLAQALVGGYESGKYDKEQAAADAPLKARMKEFQDYLDKQGLPPSASPYTAGPSAPAGGARPVAGGGVGNFDTSMARTFQFEGGLNKRDTNGTPSNFGINQKANPDVDVMALTQESAKPLYKARYWDTIGADNLPPALAHVAFDTSVIAGPNKAKELLAASGGDPAKFMELRSQFLNSLIQRDPAKYGPYARAWANRDAQLRADIAGGANPAQPGPVQVAQAGMTPDGMPLDPVRSDAPPMAYAPGGAPQAINNAMPQNPPMPPPRPGAALTQAVATPQPTAPTPPAPDPTRALLAAAIAPGASPQLRQTAMQLFQLGQREQPKWEKLNDGTLYNPRTAETRNVGGGYKPLTDPAERAKYGIPATDQSPYFLGPDGKPSALGRAQTNVNIDNKTETAADTETAKALVKRQVAALDAADKSQAALGDINTMREISRRVGSVGSTADFKNAIGPYAEALGIKIDGLDDIQAFEAVVQRLAPQMRAEGSGSTSDIEFKGMLASLPRLRNNPQAREVILDTMEANARYNIMRGDIALKVLTKEISRADGEKQMRALGDPMAAFKAFRKENPSLFSGDTPKDANQAPVRKTINGKTFEKRGNDWFEVQ